MSVRIQKRAGVDPKLLTALGVGGATGIGSYLLSGIGDKKGKYRIARAIASALLGAGAGTGAYFGYDKAAPYVKDLYGKGKAKVGAAVDRVRSLFSKKSDESGTESGDKPGDEPTGSGDIAQRAVRQYLNRQYEQNKGVPGMLSPENMYDDNGQVVLRREYLPPYVQQMIQKNNSALPKAAGVDPKLLTSLGVGGVTGVGSYLLSGLGDKKGKYRAARAIASAILGAGAGAGAYLGYDKAMPKLRAAAGAVSNKAKSAYEGVKARFGKKKSGDDAGKGEKGGKKENPPKESPAKGQSKNEPTEQPYDSGEGWGPSGWVYAKR